MMWDAAAAKIKQRGGRIHMGTRLESLRWDERTATWAIGVIASDGQWQSYTARHVISSAPIRELVGSIHPQPACKPAAESLRYRDFLTVALIVDKPDLFPDNWIYIHEPSVKVGRIQNFRSWSPEMVPDAKLACLGLEYFCFEGDGLWNASDAELIALAKKELAIIGLASRGRGQGRLRRAPEEGLSGLRRELQGQRRDHPRRAGRDAIPTLHLVGRNGMHKYNNQDHAMMTAMLTVKNIVAGETVYDVWNVNEDAEYHESGAAGEREALSSVRLVPARVAAR